eukprot:TRINITY_DN111362_c0_g1_i1.p1 TRINITY_DN111362_c0_g1~~TRINITY_DN111362_c0_g1_i1.p1  ORF type:complete len:212 (-),score=38.76 TRINITY_DN111362_c0_g1_i1:99-734(-)
MDSMLQAFIVSSSVLSAIAGTACSTESVAAIRSERIQKSLDPALLSGFWYEQSYYDLAQIGSSCQTMNFAVDNQTGFLRADFSVHYKSKPFTIIEKYDPRDVKGVYRKSVDIPGGIPGGSLVGLETAIVDAQLDAAKSRYESVTIYSCIRVPFKTLMSVIYATRSPSISNATLSKMFDTAEAQGMPISRNALQRASQDDCDPQPVSDALVV